MFTALAWMGTFQHGLEDLGFILTSVIMQLSDFVLVASPLWTSVSTSLK